MYRNIKGNGNLVSVCISTCSGKNDVRIVSKKNCPLGNSQTSFHWNDKFFARESGKTAELTNTLSENQPTITTPTKSRQMSALKISSMWEIISFIELSKKDANRELWYLACLHWMIMLYFVLMFWIFLQILRRFFLTKYPLKLEESSGQLFSSNLCWTSSSLAQILAKIPGILTCLRF